MRNGADVNAKIKEKKIVSWISEHTSSEIQQLGQWIANCEGFSPLHFACDAREPDLVRKLLRNGADVKALSAKNETPLQTASKDAPLRLPICEATRNLMEQACAPWEPTQTSHSVRSHSQREAVKAVLLTKKHLDRKASTPSTAKKLTVQQISRLDKHIFYNILSYC